MNTIMNSTYAYLQFVMHYAVPSKLIPIAALTQNIENELA